ncbi:hypothetical protein Y900_005110 [Mycolicibacterium aromaticivorans JS19b1 = JCM 16368]|uniref:Uncharacterized protein n=1 Tax=Mycolicibacterium aromaticivorans JS19b1 = JCM 16368 TaxID=1440774 RepID=A0A064CDF5_9MYCO|nr:hypothetical protein [Mycolicibacterium aromaticivorans]KDE98335.1 hypothetical protein Y900_005110 [Mycolicibacterium aromaticivorans JS19b1 = JCM 16368]
MRIVLPVIAVVLLVGAIAEFMWWILAAIVVYWLYCGGRRVLRWYQAQAFALRPRQAEIPGYGVSAF